MASSVGSAPGGNALADAARTRLWPLPTVAVAVAVAIGVFLPLAEDTYDHVLPRWVSAYLFSGGGDAARAVLEAIAGSLITVTSLTFSLTVVTLQLASSQFSPRLLRTFARDRFVHGTLALFLGTFVYALTVLRTVRTGSAPGSEFVPHVSVTLAFLFAIASVIGLVLFLAHLARQIRIETIMRDVHRETLRTVRQVFDAEPALDVVDATPSMPAVGALPIPATSSGFFLQADDAALLEAATEADAVLLIDRKRGDSLVAGVPFALAWPRDPSASLPSTVGATLAESTANAIQYGFERTSVQDVGYGFRQLVDVAMKALSPSVNDPTTAVHAIGHLSALLREVATRDTGTRLLRGDDGTVRVIERRESFAELLDLSVSQPRRYGSAELTVLERLLWLLREVAWATRRADQRAAIEHQLGILVHTVRTADYLDSEREQLLGLAETVRESLAGRWPHDSASEG